MPTITFKAKPETIYNMDGSIAYRRLKKPDFKQKHCDMQAFRDHPQFGSYANSDLFPSLLKRATRHIGEYIRLDQPLPAGVVMEDGFLHTVTITIP